MLVANTLVLSFTSSDKTLPRVPHSDLLSYTFQGKSLGLAFYKCCKWVSSLGTFRKHWSKISRRFPLLWGIQKEWMPAVYQETCPSRQMHCLILIRCPR